MLVPIGAIYTIDDLEARELANILKPKVVIPMHYKTPKLKLELCPLAPFIDAAKDCRIHNLNDCEATITKMSLGEDRVLILRPYASVRSWRRTSLPDPFQRLQYLSFQPPAAWRPTILCLRKVYQNHYQNTRVF